MRGNSNGALDALVAAAASESPMSATSWQPIDLSEALAGGDVPGPVLCRRADGQSLLYAGRTHSFSGESESCKTWAALHACAQVLAEAVADDDGACLWIDFEDDERGVVGRLRALGATPEQILSRFVYLRPEEPLRARNDTVTAGEIDLAGLLASRRFDLCVIDGVTEAMTTEGLDMLSNADVATWSRLVPKRIALATDAAVVQIDHLPKSKENQGRYAIGGQHKLAGLTGAAYRFDVRSPLSRATADQPDGVTGRVLVSVMKDRPGHVRAQCDEGKAGVLELTAYPDGGVAAAIVSATDASGTPDVKMLGRVLDHLAMYPGVSQNNITDNVPGKTDAIRECLRWMHAQEQPWIEIDRSGNSHRHTLTEEGQAQLSV